VFLRGRDESWNHTIDRAIQGSNGRGGDSMSAFRILVADDHPIFRVGLCFVLGKHEGWEVCGEATDGPNTIEMFTRLKPDLLILDICMPKLNGMDVARKILKDNPEQRILILTGVNSEQVIVDCLDAGICGWVFKSEGANDLTTAVEALQRYKSSFSSRVSDLMAGAQNRHRFGRPAVTTIGKLSPREREVVQLMAEGRSAKDAASMLNIALKTVETHRSNILRKLKLHSIAELVLYAVRNEIVHVQFQDVMHAPQTDNGRTDTALQSLN